MIPLHDYKLQCNRNLIIIFRKAPWCFLSTFNFIRSLSHSMSLTLQLSLHLSLSHLSLGAPSPNQVKNVPHYDPTGSMGFGQKAEQKKIFCPSISFTLQQTLNILCTTERCGCADLALTFKAARKKKRKGGERGRKESTETEGHRERIRGCG